MNSAKKSAFAHSSFFFPSPTRTCAITASSIATPPTVSTQGFLFAFIHYSRLENPSWVQRFVKLAVRNDVIHVAMIPVPHAEVEPHGGAQTPITRPDQIRRLLRIHTSDRAYTAFIFAGFCIQKAAHVLVPCYDFCFLPVPDPTLYAMGVHFLENLKGADYNYVALPLAILPRAWKRTRFPNWITHERPVFEDLLEEEEEQRTVTPPREPHSPKEPVRIFCSQMGLLLCYACHALPHHVYDPASCLPAELKQFLVEDAHGIECPLELVVRPSSEGD